MPDQGCIFHPVVFSPLPAFDPSFLAPVRSRIPSVCRRSAELRLAWTAEGGRPCTVRTDMPHELPKAYEPGAIEARWAEYWVQENCFTWNAGAGRFASRVHAAPAASECDGPSAHGAHDGTDADGRRRALASHEGPCGAVAAGHGPCRHRDPDAGGAPTGERRQKATRDGAREIHGARLGMAARVRRRDPRPDEAPGRVGDWAANTSPWTTICRAR